jgi:hypothetical protein
MPPRKREAAVQLAPHSWDMAHWPPHVWPHERSRARYIVRTCKTELLTAGAICRVRRELIFLGVAYTRWLETHRTHAARYDIAPNQKKNRAAP